jgi:hypothetical protein
MYEWSEKEIDGAVGRETELVPGRIWARVELSVTWGWVYEVQALLPYNMQHEIALATAPSLLAAQLAAIAAADAWLEPIVAMVRGEAARADVPVLRWRPSRQHNGQDAEIPGWLLSVWRDQNGDVNWSSRCHLVGWARGDRIKGDEEDGRRCAMSVLAASSVVFRVEGES